MTWLASVGATGPVVMCLQCAHLKAEAPRHDGVARFVARCAISVARADRWQVVLGQNRQVDPIDAMAQGSRVENIKAMIIDRCEQINAISLKYLLRFSVAGHEPAVGIWKLHLYTRTKIDRRSY